MRTTLIYKLLALFIITILATSCNQPKNNKSLIQYVNPFIGTGGHGHTYPGATSPFGMVQLSPDTRLEGWDGCSGYHYSDSVIYGFSHTHLSGTGVSDYGDLLLMPIIGEVNYDNIDYSSPFSHKNEVAEAGYYKVLLDKYKIKVELTTTPHTGMHKYYFPTKAGNKVIIDLKHRDLVKDAYIHVVNDRTIEGYRVSQAWADEQHIYFYMEFSQPFELFEISTNDSVFIADTYKGKSIISSVHFNNLENNELLVKVGISAVDIAGAKKNLITENISWDFDTFRIKNQGNWEHELSKIKIEDSNEDRKTIFYTALYHNLIVPNLFSDVDGRYRGMDMEIHKSKHKQYTIFSLWDTYRATHPLYTIIETKRTEDFINTFKNQYDDGEILPIWELAGNYTGCMIGYHSIPVIVDAYFKGLTDIPADTLLKMVLTSANANQHGLEAYRNNGYISIADDGESISKTLEYAYDDWCIAQLAKDAGRDSTYKIFIRRSQSYKNILDPNSGFMRPKLEQIWKEPFDPSEVDFNFTEANSWQYSFYVPQDIYSMQDLMGGKEKFEKQLDDLFTASTVTTGRQQSDITGLIGQYAHGNEPSHHMAYLYNYVNKSAKTQDYLQQIYDEMYSNKPNGLSGNEDCGQMSAWYVLSTMGFYPVNPANGEFVFGKPLFDNVKLNLENGNIFEIIKSGDKGDKAYVNAIKLNGNTYSKAYIKYSDIMSGGTLEFIMKKNEAIIFDNSALPNSRITDNIILSLPSIIGAKRSFSDSTLITMDAERGSIIFMDINNKGKLKYSEPFYIYETSKIVMWAENGNNSSKKIESNLYCVPKGMSVEMKTKWHTQYPAGEKIALIDGIIGGANFRNGSWQGYQWDDVEGIVDLGKLKTVNEISMNFIQDSRSWIFMPNYVEYYGSIDGKDFTLLGKIDNNVPKMEMTISIKTFRLNIKAHKYRYIKFFAKNHNICPKGHFAEGGRGYVFIDEIIIE
ncbi:MAG: GH92 family glycosyl hydrolase [Bacteroidales bacterium]|nr:GH92 family glycosyl hydrolase [Bacteroidales bacterium]